MLEAPVEAIHLQKPTQYRVTVGQEGLGTAPKKGDGEGSQLGAKRTRNSETWR